jgi:hypothetical protein
MLQLQVFEPRWAQMWALAFALYFGCKVLTWRQATAPRAPIWRHTAYLMAWPGMDANSFLAGPRHARRSNVAAIEWLPAVVKLASGVVLLFGIARLVAEHDLYLAGWIGGAGLVLTLHFGVFHLLSCFWRRAGIAAPALMQRPLALASLGDFWGRRWNTAFRDLTHRLIFRPFASRLGSRWALAISFLVSGAIHDLVISLPARGEYGAPTLFFAIQGAGVLIERSDFGRRAGLQSGLTARVFAFAVLILPAPLLFHRPFMLGVMVPFLRALGAI